MMPLEDFFRRATFVALLVLAIIAGGLTGLVTAYQATFSSFAIEVDSLSEYRPPEVTKVYADDGKTIIGELALERRIPLAYEEIPERMKQAILAIEDTRFDDHIGIDPVRVVGAFVQNLVRNRRAQGASTLTQQLARLLFLSPEKTYTRKAKEVMYALQIERVYTKEQIMTLYCNQIFLGGGAYGIEAGANYYFSKSAKDLSLEQFALLAAIPKAPSQYSPVHHAKVARDRRNLVLQSMAEAGFVPQNEVDEAKEKPLGLDLDDTRGKHDRSPNAYFVEEVRQELQRLLVEKHKEDAMDVYRAGLSVYTTLDAKAQLMATRAVRKGLLNYEKRHGATRLKFDNLVDKGNIALEDYRHPSWSAVPQGGDSLTGLVMEVSDRQTVVSFGSYRATVTAKDTEAFGRSLAKLFKRGDLAEFEILSVDEAKRAVTVKLEPEPRVQGALVLLDASSGEIKAMVGGYNFATSKFNHATQANRQTGSAFKPFIYAAALEQGLRPNDIVNDAPFKRGNWVPHNYDNNFMGAMPLRKALALSRNIPAVRVLDEIGVNNTTQLVRRLGLPNPMAPFLPSALGATEEPLLAMVSAYSAFPNGGVRVEPARIRKVVDRDGNVIDEAKPKSFKAISTYVAAQMVDMMQGVVQSGTAASANSLGRELAGKTGTVNDYTDAWFIGYTPSEVCGVWIGYSDNKKTLGKGESGSSAALPFWIDFMKEYLSGKPKEKFGPIPPIPDDLKVTQATRSKERAAEMERIAAQGGDILPGSSDIPNLDPLANVAAPTPTPEPPPPPAPVRVVVPPPPAQVEAKPKASVQEPVKKGKKGKGNDN
ncbi:MAG: PBP1A family penicillin-binding protein [Acidobacteriota bacterium]